MILKGFKPAIPISVIILTFSTYRIEERYSLSYVVNDKRVLNGKIVKKKLKKKVLKIRRKLIVRISNMEEIHTYQFLDVSFIVTEMNAQVISFLDYRSSN